MTGGGISSAPSLQFGTLTGWSQCLWDLRLLLCYTLFGQPVFLLVDKLSMPGGECLVAMLLGSETNEACNLGPLACILPGLYRLYTLKFRACIMLAIRGNTQLWFHVMAVIQRLLHVKCFKRQCTGLGLQ